MPFKKGCCCTRHTEWFHGAVSPENLRVAVYSEFPFCKDSSRHKSRKQFICLACRNRIETDATLRRLEDQAESAECESSHEETIPMDEGQHGEMLIDMASVFDSSLDESVGETSVVEEMVTEQLAQTPPKESDSQSEQPPIANLLEPARDKASPGRAKPYQLAKERAQRSMRAELCTAIETLVRTMTPEGTDYKAVMADLTESPKWKEMCGGKGKAGPLTVYQDHFLKQLAEEYHNCKDKEENKQVRAQGAKLTKKIKIGSTLKESRISLDGSSSAGCSSRVEAAKSVGRIRAYSDLKRRLLSIVAFEYPYRVLKEYFRCSDKTVVEARVHRILYGRGGVASDNLKFSKQKISQEVLDDLIEFLNRDNISRPSSFRSVMVDGQETGVRYWQDSVQNIVQQYLLEFPNGVKRSYIYSHLPRNFRMDTMLAGLCNIRYDDGYTNFEDIRTLVNDIVKDTGDKSLLEQLKTLEDHERYLRTQFAKQVMPHSTCQELCLHYAFGSCQEPHPHSSPAFTAFYQLCARVTAKVAQASSEDKRKEFESRWDECLKVHWQYCGHIMRTKHQADYYRFIMANLKPGQMVVVIDYKMKLELGVTTRENQRQWYGKRGISLHGCYIFAKNMQNDKVAEVIDLWCEDTKQDSWFTQSALDVIFAYIGKRFEGYSVFLFSDNGPHYHNSGVILYLAEVREAFDLTLVEHNFFEAGEGKTILDTHFAHISHKIIRWVRVGNDLESGEQLADLLQSMSNVSCDKLIIDRQRAPKSVTTISNISLFGNFKIPSDGEYAGGIVTQSLVGIGKQSSKKQSKRSKIAANTGTTTAAENFPLEQPVSEVGDADDTSGSYAVRFIQHVPDQVSDPHLEDCSDDYRSYQRQNSGFALKQSSGVRTVFSARQKGIMIEFF